MLLLTALWPHADRIQLRAHARTLVRMRGLPDATALGRLKVLTVQVRQAQDVDPELWIALPHSDLFLSPWEAEQDKRPKVALPRYLDPEWQPGGAKLKATNGYIGSARHGECTSCNRDKKITQAVYRITDKRRTYSRSSLCAHCARKYLGPVEVPRFASAEEAQAWLDAQDGAELAPSPLGTPPP